MEYKQVTFIDDFMNRTKENQNIIDRNVASMKNGYEITQRINSMFGFVIMPQEKFAINDKNPKEGDVTGKIITDIYNSNINVENAFEQIRSILIECYENHKYYNSYEPKDPYNIKQYNPVQLYRVLQHLRNAIAHGGNEGLRFLPISDPDEKEKSFSKDITDIIFYDHKNDDCKEFCICINVLSKNGEPSQLDKLIDNISEIYKEVENRVNEKLGDKKVNKELKKQYDYYKKLMEKPHQ